VTEEEWLHFVTTGLPKKLRVTRIPDELCRIVGANTNLVRIRHDYTLKVAFKHELDPHRFPMMQNAIDFGRAIQDRPLPWLPN